MKKGLFFVLSLSLSLLGSSCTFPFGYGDKEVNIYRNKKEPDKKIKVRFYNSLKRIPYIKISEYIKEFLGTVPKIKEDKESYTYSLQNGAYLNFDFKNNTLSCNDLTSFSSLSPNNEVYEGQSFVFLESSETTIKEVKTISLDKYNIRLKSSSGEVYAPVSFLSKLFGGLMLFDVTYNGTDLYVFDMSSTGDNERAPGYYGATYNVLLNNLATRRYEDTAKYAYNELCFVFDNFKGETTRTIIDNDKLSLGLDNALTTYYPDLKEFLLSRDKLKYYAGLYTLFLGLYDGGHTGVLTNFITLITGFLVYVQKQPFYDLFIDAATDVVLKLKYQEAFKKARKNSFGVEGENYYYYSNETKTAFLGFDSFVVDYKGWDLFYKKEAGIPVNSDTFAFIRTSFDKAKEDGAENLIIDLTTNGGGDTTAYNGIVGLLNHARSDMYYKDTFNNYFARDNYLVDLNLDGEFSEQDKFVTDNYDFNVTIMTSQFSFSCGNLLPSKLKDLGYKTIGQATGGGSCAVSLNSTPDGINYANSSHITLFNDAGENIDSGVFPDRYMSLPFIGDSIDMDASSFFDVKNIQNITDSLYKN